MRKKKRVRRTGTWEKFAIFLMVAVACGLLATIGWGLWWRWAFSWDPKFAVPLKAYFALWGAMTFLFLAAVGVLASLSFLVKGVAKCIAAVAHSWASNSSIE